MNAAGYVWLDNHVGNFAFVPVTGADAWQVAIFDPGGLVKIREDAGVSAREVQRRHDFPVSESEFADLRPDWRNQVYREEFLEAYGDALQLPEGLTSAEQIPFNADTFLFYPRSRQLGLTDDPAELRGLYQALRRGALDAPRLQAE